MGKKSSANTASKISALATKSASSSSNQSSILKSSFAPSYLQLQLFASVIQSFESQQLRIHDTSTGRLKQQYSTPTGTNITCLDWGYYGAAYRERRFSKNKKRKRLDDQQEDVVVAYGTSDSEVAMYSPAQGKVVGLLKGVHQRGIKDFKFDPANNLEAWSIAGDGNLIQWDLRTDQPVKCVLTMMSKSYERWLTLTQDNLASRSISANPLLALFVDPANNMCLAFAFCRNDRSEG